MKHTENLRDALNKAISRGYVPLKGVDQDYLTFKIKSHRIIFSLLNNGNEVGVSESSIYGTIFDHDFAKSLWGVYWVRHLQQMVVADDPLEYLGRNLPK